MEVPGRRARRVNLDLDLDLDLVPGPGTKDETTKTKFGVDARAGGGRSLGPPLEGRPESCTVRERPGGRPDGCAPMAVDGGERRQGCVRREPLDPVLRGVPGLVRGGAPPPRALGAAVPPGRPRPLRLGGARDPRRQGPPLEALRPAVRARPPSAARRRTGGGAGGALPHARHLRALWPREQAHHAPRPERLGEVVDPLRAGPRDGGVLPRARGRALPLPLGVPERAEAEGRRRARVRPAARRRATSPRSRTSRATRSTRASRAR